MENLIDLGNYPRNDVDLIAREFIRQVYLEVMGDYATEADKIDDDRDETVLQIIEELLKSLERVIILLDGNDEFLNHIHASTDDETESEEEDSEYDRF